MYHKNICVIGAGYWGYNHIKTLHELGALYGVVDSNPKTIDKISQTYNYIKTFKDIDNALDDSKIKGFTVCTPPETHYQLSKKITSSRKHVLVEKPFTLDISEAEELCNLSKKHSTIMMVGHVLLFHPAIIKIKELIEQGKIGKLQYIYSNRLNLGQVRTQENVFWSLAPHDIAIFQYLIGSQPNSIKASGSAFLQERIVDSTITKLKYNGGVEGHIFVSWLHPFKEHRLVVIGSEAMISFQDSDEKKPLKFYSKKFDMKNGFPKKIDGPTKEIEYERKMPLTEELKYFLDSFNSGIVEKSGANHALEVTKILVEASRQIK